MQPLLCQTRSESPWRVLLATHTRQAYTVRRRSWLASNFAGSVTYIARVHVNFPFQRALFSAVSGTRGQDGPNDAPCGIRQAVAVGLSVW
jgi:hypothetical protein